jgi:hypothetical protein
MSVGVLLLAAATIGAIALLVSVEVVTASGASYRTRRRVGVLAAIVTIAFVVLTAMRFTGGI